MNRPLILAFILLGAQACMAATTCRFGSGGGVAFGPYDTLSTASVDSSLNLLVSCDRNGGPQNVTLTVSLGTGINGTSVNNRRMAHSGGTADFLSYGLFRDASRSGVWGFSPGIDTVDQTLSVPNKGSATATFTVYGRLPARQNVSAGSYGDIVQITLSP